MLTDASLIESQDMDDVQPKQQTSYQMDHAAAAVSDRGHQAPPQAEARPGRLAGMPHESPEGEPDGSLGSDIPGAYNALEFKHLNVSDEVRALFQHIGRYKPQVHVILYW
jgi:intraflagellar transport protein 46